MVSFNNSPIPSVELPDWSLLSQIPIVDCAEKLLPASLAPLPISIYPVYSKMAIPSAPAECYLRQSVYYRLIKAAKLLPPGMRLIVLDGWRPFSVQQHLFETLLNFMTTANPEQHQDCRLSQARNLVSPPNRSQTNPSPHLTGGAIDVTLANEFGEPLNMGSLFDEASAASYTASFEQIEHPTATELEVRDNRRILFNTMHTAGFTNLPSEWWHFDFGDQLWAWYTRSPQAIYGPTQPQSLELLWQEQLGVS